MQDILKGKTVGLAALCVAVALAPAMAETQPVRQCKSYVQGRIDVLDAELHKGDKPNVAHKLVKRREKLKAQLAECEHNPRAYLKQI